MKHIVQLSGGKDSTAMLLMMLERNMPVDEILFCDTGVEFPAMYEHLKRVEQYTGRQITRLKAKHDFYWWFWCNQKVKGKMVSTVSYTCSACNKHCGRDDKECPYCHAEFVDHIWNPPADIKEAMDKQRPQAVIVVGVGKSKVEL